MTYAAPANGAINSDQHGELAARDLAHIPGEDGWPLIGNTFRLLADPKGEVERLAARYGPVYRNRAFGGRIVNLLGPEANEFVLFDRARNFSSAGGWNPILGRLFPRGLMLLDFDEHRLHRKALSIAFKAEPMRAYLDGLNAGVAAAVARWLAKPGERLIYPAMKQLTLDLAAGSFFGRDLGADGEPLKRAFVDMVAAAVAPVRAPWPGTAMARGVRGRRFMVEFLGREIAARREGAGEDLFSQLCRASTDEGRLLTPAGVVDHMSFFMMAAHDTLTSSLTGFVWFLSSHPQWQARLREEFSALNLPRGAPLPYERLDDLPLTEMAFKETLRLLPPVPSIPAASCATPNFGGFASPPAPAWRSIRSTPTICRRFGRSRTASTPALHRGAFARPPQIRVRPLWRRRAYVPGAELRLHAGQVLRVPFYRAAQTSVAPGYKAELADVAHPQAARQSARDDASGGVDAGP